MTVPDQGMHTGAATRTVLLEQMLQASPDGLVVVDDRGIVVAANARAAELFGYEGEDLLGRCVDDLVPARVRQAHTQHRADYWVEGRTRAMGAGMTLLGVRRDGTEFPVDIALSTIRTPGAPRLALAAVRDVSDRMALVAQLSAARDAADSAREVAEQARAAADLANKAKSEFLSRMSHELRTPLNAILGFAQLLDLDELTSDQEESVRHIRKAGEHLLLLINEVLDISRVEAGHLRLSLEPVAAADAVQESVDLVRPQAAARDITIAFPLLEQAPAVLADAQRLKQILVNLLSNAVKYNHPGGRVDITWQRAADRVHIAVRDSGPGIPEHLRERVFTPFDRLGADLSGVPGSGVGLALSQRLSEAMNGSLTLLATTGPGATFLVDLPAAEPAAAHEPAIPGQTHRATSEHTVLYIEDNLSNLRLVERVVSRRPNWRLVHALHGQLGIELAQSQRPDLILLDLHLPDMSGEQILAVLREGWMTEKVPVWFITADATPGQADRLLAAGADGHMTKPVDVVQLLALLDSTGAAGSAE